MSRFASRALDALVPLTIATLLAGCQEAAGPRDLRTVRLSVGTAPMASTALAANASALATPRMDLVLGNGTLVITRAQIVLRDIELKMPGLVCGVADSSRSRGSDDDCEIELGPRLVDLPLTPGIAPVADVAVPAGTYRELELKLHKPDDDDARDRAFIQAHPGFRRISVRVEGTWNGEPFVFITDRNAKMELEFRPALVVDESGVNITVNIDVAAWFRGSAGGVIRPSAANARLIEDNIRSSFRAFGDRDRDGRDDDRS